MAVRAPRIALRTRLAAYITAFFVLPMVRTYEKPVALATILWTVWVWGQRGVVDVPLAIACAAVGVLAVVRKLAYREADRLPQRYYDAFARGDADELAALNRLFTLFYSDRDERRAHDTMRLGEEMIVRKRWPDAQAALEKVDLEWFPPHSRAVVLNNLAYATARNGNPVAALEIVERAYAEGDKAAGAKMTNALPSMRATHAIALTLAGRHEEALPLLELCVKEGTARSRNERLYWLGYVERMLGRDDEARIAFAQAIELGGPCTEEARAALADGTPFRG